MVIMSTPFPLFLNEVTQTITAAKLKPISGSREEELGEVGH